jgi:hypothetical protein
MCAKLIGYAPQIIVMRDDFKLNIPELCAASDFFQRGNVLREMRIFGKI